MIVEGSDEALWGRVSYDDNLIVESAATLQELIAKMKSLLLAFHDINPDDVQLNILFDLVALFEEFNFLNISKVADASGLNGSLLRQYATGKKFPSAKQAEKVQEALRQIASRLAEVHIYTK
ncbi:hypothetical protein SAMN04487996_10419 [Dyadobacter soli]|uniref:Uncharacterized protein n=2 Tax=Dyadobacter soli TaxID=659014 RepID=A0A1G7AZ46_9BACT|nr:hypothetical protein SAMN04487996_10419 [Dyadobacter soli]